MRSHSQAGIGLGTTIKYPQRTTAQRPENNTTHNERCHLQQIGHLDKVPATHDERRRGKRLKPMPGTINVLLHHMRLAFAFLKKACLIRLYTE
jgi:hypothetical protein